MASFCTNLTDEAQAPGQYPHTATGSCVHYRASRFGCIWKVGHAPHIVVEATPRLFAAVDFGALTRARDTAEEDYKAGAIALTDVLDADRELLAAQDDLVRVHTDTARATVGLFRALGGGW